MFPTSLIVPIMGKVNKLYQQKFQEWEDLQCCFFFKQAQFYKETGEKRALFQQQKVGEKWAKFKNFKKNTGVFCDQAPAGP